MKHLVALKFYFHQELYGIDFKYNDPVLDGRNNGRNTLGRHRCDRPACSGGHWFSIDGPSGEVIAAVDVVLLVGDKVVDSVVDVKICFHLSVFTQRPRIVG